MNDREIMEEAIRRMKEIPIPPPDDRPFWLRLLASLKCKVSGSPDKPKVEITGGTDF